MSDPEIPLLRESDAFVRRLVEASRFFNDSRYRFHRRVNWSHRHASQFYATESDCFRAAPEAYLSHAQNMAPHLEDVWPLRLGIRQLANVMLKVVAHWLFYLLGRLCDAHIRQSGTLIYRKGYVDDIELVFDPDQPGVTRAIYPFPINASRQLRYLRYLRKKGYPFKLDGNPYSPLDVLHFLRRRDVLALCRLESRAQIRHARKVAALGVRTIQLSDEFDIGSLDFCRMLNRFPVHVVNSAHGAGKYFPVHAYHEFYVITHRQLQYYHAVLDCRYSLRALNDTSRAVPVLERMVTALPVSLVFLSQSSAGISDVIVGSESLVVQQLAAEFTNSATVRLLYRPHPNNHSPTVPNGFQRLWRLEEVNGQPGTVYVSFFSTCQIDPAFKGTKVLLRAKNVYPEIVFDESESILDINQFINFINKYSTL